MNCLSGSSSSIQKKKKYWKQKLKQQRIQSRINFKKEIFGEHYNYDTVKINKNNKYFQQEIQATHIEKNNRILLEKIKKISERSVFSNKHQSKANSEVQRPLYRSTQPSEAVNNHVKFFNDNTYQCGCNKSRHECQYEYEQPPQYRRISNRSRIKTQQQKQFSTQQPQSLLKSSLEKPVPNSQHSKQQTHKKENENLPSLPSPSVYLKEKYYLFKGSRIIGNVEFQFSIYIVGSQYHILAETPSTQQKIQISLKNYHLLLKKQLQGQHLNIFNFLRLIETQQASSSQPHTEQQQSRRPRNPSKNKLVLIGTENLEIELMDMDERQQALGPKRSQINAKTQPKKHMTPSNAKLPPIVPSSSLEPSKTKKSNYNPYQENMYCQIPQTLKNRQLYLQERIYHNMTDIANAKCNQPRTHETKQNRKNSLDRA